MPFSHLYDVAMSDDGDFLVDETGDLAVARNHQVIRSDVLIRILTQTPEFWLYPWLGADLQDFFGEPNSNATAERIRARLIDVLTLASNLNPEDLEITIIPVEESLILVLSIHDQAIVEVFEIQLSSGLLRRLPPDAD